MAETCVGFHVNGSLSLLQGKVLSAVFAEMAL